MAGDERGDGIKIIIPLVRMRELSFVSACGVFSGSPPQVTPSSRSSDSTLFLNVSRCSSKVLRREDLAQLLVLPDQNEKPFHHLAHLRLQLAQLLDLRGVIGAVSLQPASVLVRGAAGRTRGGVGSGERNGPVAANRLPGGTGRPSGVRTGGGEVSVPSSIGRSFGHSCGGTISIFGGEGARGRTASSPPGGPDLSVGAGRDGTPGAPSSIGSVKATGSASTGPPD